MKGDSYLFAADEKSSLPRARARYIAQAIQLEEQKPRGIISGAIFISLLFLVSGIIWASVTRVSETATAPGEVVPAGLNINIQHLEGGLVTELSVRNGDAVNKGDLLLRLDPTSLRSELDQAQARRAALELQAARLDAILGHTDPDFDEAGQAYPGFAAKQLTIYRAQMKSLNQQLDVIDSQIRQRETELTRQRHDVVSSRREVALLKEQVDLRAKLAKSNLVARTELLSSQSMLAKAEGALRQAIDGVAVAGSSLEEARQRRAEIEAAFYKDIELEAGRIAADLAEVSQTLIRLKHRLSQTDIHSPVDGIVQGLVINSHNAVVEPGKVIMQIVPVNDVMIIEARISPTDIGYIHEGLQANIKVDSYDAARFGSVEGTVKRISASTYLDAMRTPYYRAELALASDHVGDVSSNLRIIPGMTVRAEIRTGSKSILDYLMKPITRGFDSAFQER